jgi:hypothetical protein
LIETSEIILGMKSIKEERGINESQFADPDFPVWTESRSAILSCGDSMKKAWEEIGTFLSSLCP